MVTSTERLFTSDPTTTSTTPRMIISGSLSHFVDGPVWAGSEALRAT
jgi:hypothetical protein